MIVCKDNSLRMVWTHLRKVRVKKEEQGKIDNKSKVNPSQIMIYRCKMQQTLSGITQWLHPLKTWTSLKTLCLKNLIIVKQSLNSLKIWLPKRFKEWSEHIFCGKRLNSELKKVLTGKSMKSFKRSWLPKS